MKHEHEPGPAPHTYAGEIEFEFLGTRGRVTSNGHIIWADQCFHTTRAIPGMLRAIEEARARICPNYEVRELSPAEFDLSSVRLFRVQAG